MNGARRVLLTAWVALVAAAGCGQRDLVTCDITQRACQINIYYRMLNLRGDGYDPFGGLPPVKVISEDDYRAMLLRMQADAAAQNGPSPWDKALELLHFTAPAPGPSAGGVADGGAGQDAGNSTIDDEVAHVYAFYDSQTKIVTVISHPELTGADAEEEAMITLAHELVHALQDRELDLNRQDFHTSDEYLAYDTVIEGDARFYEDLFRADVMRLMGQNPIPATDMPDAELNFAYAHFDELGAPLFAASYLVYPLGAKYEATAYRSGGNAAVRHAYATAPHRTVGFLVGADGHAPPVGSGDVCRPPYVPALPTDGDSVGADQLGALPLYTFLRGWGVDHDTAFATAQSWTGDYLWVQASTDYSTTAVSWRLEFSLPVPAGIASALIATGGLTVNAGLYGLDITANDSPTPLAWQAVSCP